jgi:homoserine dehydrogenase
LHWRITTFAIVLNLFRMQASCGAGLPIVSTLKGLIESGDKVIAIEGILSGTLSYIFNTWHPGQPFSDVVSKAKELGYTEPDPREDLSGSDIARKVCMCGRELSSACAPSLHGSGGSKPSTQWPRPSLLAHVRAQRS